MMCKNLNVLLIQCSHKTILLYMIEKTDTKTVSIKEIYTQIWHYDIAVCQRAKVDILIPTKDSSTGNPKKKIHSLHSWYTISQLMQAFQYLEDKTDVV